MRSVVLCNDTACIIGQHVVAYGDMGDCDGRRPGPGVVTRNANRYIPGLIPPSHFFFFSQKPTVGYAHARERTALRIKWFACLCCGQSPTNAIRSPRRRSLWSRPSELVKASRQTLGHKSRSPVPTLTAIASSLPFRQNAGDDRR